ncbi:hypothetical protein [Caldibacillus thermoamylovorans]|uniref:hypothetical protein n=1 Tax=Caldibacillus thermoamylovorans TaxID=35841 RepID=UPI0005B74433|nr:hypothetical protein [Caldibacillus thermoamylovorans]KIO71073.1 hypothetical protein B4166_0484 [Caldibacillus thermoamylovorans]
MKMTNKIIQAFIFMFLLGLFLQNFYGKEIHAAEPTAQQHSGGFVVSSDKVEGTIDLLGALFGNVNIPDGQIEGLKITKTLNTGGFGNLKLNIESPGPIPVKNLKAKTIDGKMPEFSGLCKPSKLLWICLENVQMTLVSQSVQNISIPNMKVNSCFESECPNLKKMMLQGTDQQERQQKLAELKSLLEANPDSKAKIEAFLPEAYKIEDIKGTDDLFDYLIKLLKGELDHPAQEENNQDESVHENPAENQNTTENVENHAPEEQNNNEPVTPEQEETPNDSQPENPNNEPNNTNNGNTEKNNSLIEPVTMRANQRKQLLI